MEGFDQILQARRSELSATLEHLLPPGSQFVWEVGCGHGHFLTAYAAAHPGRVCIGIDLCGDRIERAMRKRDRAALPHLHFIRADASMFLECLPATVTPADTFVLFPDPWPKKRHQKHRILRTPFLEGLAARVGEGGRLFFRTDHLGYYEDAAAAVAARADWELLPAETAWPFEHETVFQSRARHGFRSFVASRRVSRESEAAAAPISPEVAMAAGS